ncbi:MAG: tetratricopeptide repeat protein [Chloroflexota bacterium]
MDPKLDFGELLDKYLTKEDRSGRWLSQRLDINAATVTRWRNGSTRPKNAEMVGRIADILSIPPEERETFFDAAGYLYAKKDEGGKQHEDAQESEQNSKQESESKNAHKSKQKRNDTRQGRTNAPEQISPTDILQPSKRLPPADTGEPQIQPNGPHPIQEDTDVRRDVDVEAQPFSISRLSQRNLLLLLLSIVIILIAIIVVTFNIFHETPLPTTRKFAIGELQNLSPGTSPVEEVLVQDTRRILYQKLSVVDGLEGIFWDRSPATPEARNLLDLWIEGAYKQLNKVELSASIFEGPEKIFVQSVSAQAQVDERRSGVDICILAVQTQLAEEILAALGVAADAEETEQIQKTPTASCQALNLNNDAVLLAYQGNHQIARVKLHQALEHDPNYADAYSNLGWVLRRQQEKEEAVQAYKTATELQPAHPLYWFNLGLSYEDVGKLDDAVAAYNRATNLDPTYVKALNNLGFTYLLMGELTKAEEQIQAGLKVNGQAAYLHKNLGRIYLEQERTEEAIAALNQAIDLFQPYVEALYYLLVAYDEQNAAEKFCEVWQRYQEVAVKDLPERQEQAGEIERKYTCEGGV